MATRRSLGPSRACADDGLAAGRRCEGEHYNVLQAFARCYRRRVPHKLYKQLLLLDEAMVVARHMIPDVSTISLASSGPR